MTTQKDCFDEINELCAIAMNRKIYTVIAEPGFFIRVADGSLGRFRPSSVDVDASLLQTELGIDVSPPDVSGKWRAKLGRNETRGDTYCEAVSALGAAVGNAICVKEKDNR